MRPPSNDRESYYDQICKKFQIQQYDLVYEHHPNFKQQAHDERDQSEAQNTKPLDHDDPKDPQGKANQASSAME